MLSNLKAAIWKLCDIAAMPQLKSLVKRCTSTSSWRVGVATDAQNNPIVLVPVENILMVGNYIVDPTTDRETAIAAGDMLDTAIAELAAGRQITRILIEVPASMERQPDEKWLRVIERPVSQVVTSLSNYQQLPATPFVN